MFGVTKSQPTTLATLGESLKDVWEVILAKLWQVCLKIKISTLAPVMKTQKKRKQLRITVSPGCSLTVVDTSNFLSV